MSLFRKRPDEKLGVVVLDTDAGEDDREVLRAHQAGLGRDLHGKLVSPKKWVEKTEAIGIISKGGRYGGAFAHTDIAFEFASWISAEFKMYVIQDYKRLKSDENSKNFLIYL